MNTASDTNLIEAYRRARQRFAADAGVTMLYIGVDESVLVFGHGDNAPAIVRFGVGTAVLAAAVLRHDPPAALEIEHAIALIEDAVMPLARRLPPSSVLVASGGAMHELAAIDSPLTLADVEQQFQQLAAVAEGRPAASSGWPSNPAFAATLTILREFMHHLAFASVRVV